MMTTTEFLNQVDEKWAELQTFVASLRPEQYTSPTDAAGWSVQDHLLHLSEWEAGVTALLNYQDR
ncbi:MAG: maleylpyruvate isomerase N-terminal domain-containing protein, partial [Anaerolineae bacterium]|nr:maleylpyruvate isomerase N-terminal domain-containing protein [Anaerolineae bacterium]